MRRSGLREFCFSALKAQRHHTTIFRRDGSTSAYFTSPGRSSRPIVSDDFHLLETGKWSEKLIDTAAAGQAKGDSGGWSYGYQAKAKQKERLIRTVQNGSRRLPVRSTLNQLQTMNWDTWATDPTDVTSSNRPTLPGTLVEIRRSGSITHAVVLGLIHERGLRIISLTSAGEILAHGEQDIMLAIPSYIDEALTKRCGLITPEVTSSQLTARISVLKRIRDIEQAIEKVSNLVYTRAQGLYEALKSPDPGNWSRFDISTAATIVKPSTSVRLPILFAVHKFLMAHPVHFVAHPTSYQYTHSFLVRPKFHVDIIETVTTWMRDQSSGVLDAFVDKTKMILAESRRLRDESVNEPPQVHTGDFNNIRFDDNDRVILQFLYDSFQPARSIQQNPYAIPSTYILKRLGEDPFPAMNSETLLRVLTDIGVFTPWEDTPNVASQIEILSNKPKESPPPISTRADYHPSGPEDLYTSDPLESIRHDFGDMPVYVIDDATAEELDDGISIEPIPSDPHCAWVHVHVADPTRLLPPTHRIATQARQQLETMYFIHGSTPMLPSDSMFNALSLGATSTTGGAEHVMTFSVKVDGMGDIIDYKVRAGIVRNVRIVTYDEVDQMLDIPPCQPGYPFQSEAPPSIARRTSELTPFNVDQLRSLYRLSQKLIESRNRLDVFMFSFPSAQVSFMSKDLPQRPSLKTMDRPHFFRGFPTMTYSVTDFTTYLTGARVMISEFMKAASRVASRFGIDRGVPLVRRLCAPATTRDPEDLATLAASRNSMGQVDPWAAVRSNVLIPRVINAIQPKGHWTLGIPNGEGYVRVTSPLRRYADLMTHWQIKHALLNPDSPPLFPETWLADFANELTLKEREIKRVGSQHQAYWSGVYMKRWLDGRIATDLDPNGTFIARPMSVPVMDGKMGGWSTSSILPLFGIRGELLGKEDMGIGSEVPVRIASIVLGIRPMISLIPV